MASLPMPAASSVILRSSTPPAIRISLSMLVQQSPVSVSSLLGNTVGRMFDAGKFRNPKAGRLAP